MTRKNEQIVGKKIKAAMIEADLSPKELAKKLGITQAAISRWIVGKGNPKVSTLQKFAEATGKTLNYFFDNNNIGDNNTIAIGGQKANSAAIELLRKDIELLKKEIDNINLRLQLNQNKKRKK